MDWGGKGLPGGLRGLTHNSTRTYLLEARAGPRGQKGCRQTHTQHPSHIETHGTLHGHETTRTHEVTLEGVGGRAWATQALSEETDDRGENGYTGMKEAKGRGGRKGVGGRAWATQALSEETDDRGERGRKRGEGGKETRQPKRPPGGDPRQLVLGRTRTHGRTSSPTPTSPPWPPTGCRPRGQTDSRTETSKLLPYAEKATIRCEQGRYIFTKGTILDQTYTFANVYAPNTKQHQFLGRALNTLMKFTEGTLIIGGDLNLALHPDQDSTSPQGATPHNRHANTLRLLHHHQLADCWRALHPTDRDYTFYSRTHATYTRLDYFLTPHQNLTLLTTAEILPMTWSDHCPIRIRMKSPLFRPKQMLWRLNESLLSDTTVVDKISDSIRTYFEENETDDVTPLTCWEAHKTVIRGQIIAISASRKKTAIQAILDLSRDIAALEARHKRTLDATTYGDLVSYQRLQLITILQSENTGWSTLQDVFLQNKFMYAYASRQYKATARTHRTKDQDTRPDKQSYRRVNCPLPLADTDLQRQCIHTQSRNKIHTQTQLHDTFHSNTYEPNTTHHPQLHPLVPPGRPRDAGPGAKRIRA
ncbi:Hypothetical predicted protein [Pelobates cultripes]|uniref:Endonuclease/exonuclease/phosphatase domain-containing protein n=1 Tax=Pelobates cultripes TaxID=61616 RepID=A0AAD1WLG7_PELCU|nr:Hypothetical predicted protein [Pelobates cultripes]